MLDGTFGATAGERLSAVMAAEPGLPYDTPFSDLVVNMDFICGMSEGLLSYHSGFCAYVFSHGTDAGFLRDNEPWLNLNRMT